MVDMRIGSQKEHFEPTASVSPNGAWTSRISEGFFRRPVAVTFGLPPVVEIPVGPAEEHLKATIGVLANGYAGPVHGPTSWLDNITGRSTAYARFKWISSPAFGSRNAAMDVWGDLGVRQPVQMLL